VTTPAPATTAGRAEPDLTYRVAGMTCEHCKIAVTDEVSHVPGVTSVDVDLISKLVRIRAIDVSDDAVIAAIAEAGYEALRA